MAVGFLELSPPDGVIFSATRPVVFIFSDVDDLSTGAPLTSPGTIFVNGTKVITFSGLGISTVDTRYSLTITEPEDEIWHYTVTPLDGWPDGEVTVQIQAEHGHAPFGTYSQTRTLVNGGLYEGEHTETALSRLLEQFGGSVNLRLFVRSWVDRVQECEDAATQLLHDRTVFAASGAQLDGVGQLVAVGRDGRTDEDYRLRLRGELAILFSQGSTEDIIDIFALLFTPVPPDDPPNPEIVDYYPKTLYIRPIDHTLTDDPVAVAALLRRAVPAATELLFVYALHDDNELFTLSTQGAVSESSGTLGLTNTTQTFGGRLSGVA